jgi:hypothetical protein
VPSQQPGGQLHKQHYTEKQVTKGNKQEKNETKNDKTKKIVLT